jgi:SAM-dependent methyltransferase
VQATDQVAALRELVEGVVKDASLIDLVISNPRQKGPETADKVTVRPVQLRQDLNYQFAYYQGEKVRHENLPPEETEARILELMSERFRQARFRTGTTDYQVLVSKRGKPSILRRAASRETGDLSHNRRKQYIIPEDVPNTFLARLGVMNARGKVLASKYDKFRQINRFLEMVADVVPALPKVDRPLRIVDFGCGKSYLTFALYQYLVEKLDLDVKITGLDLKRDVVEHCEGLARELRYDGLHFEQGDIREYQADGAVDLTVSLHACDTATDAALGQAIRWGAKVILAVPCCQHELMHKMSNPLMRPLEKHGIVKERLAALVTDSMRANILEIMGYNTQILEFIDTEHTPKNLLIRAVYTGHIPPQAKEEYLRLRDFWGASPSLERILGETLQARLEGE